MQTSNHVITVNYYRYHYSPPTYSNGSNKQNA